MFFPPSFFYLSSRASLLKRVSESRTFLRLFLYIMYHFLLYLSTSLLFFIKLRLFPAEKTLYVIIQYLHSYKQKRSAVTWTTLRNHTFISYFTRDDRPQLPIIMLMISSFVSFIPSFARRPTLRIVASIPAVTIPSPSSKF